jgi:iron complex outermembrane receptor protein
MPVRRSSTSFVPTPFTISTAAGIPYPRSAVALAVLVAMMAGSAHAQEAAAPMPADTSTAAPAPPVSAEPVQEVVITGSQIRGVSAAGSKSVVLDRDALVATGYNNPIDVLKTVPLVQGLGYGDVPSTAQNGSANVQRGSTISLRGLSSSATLVLIDGRRIAPTGNVTTFTEANQLPVSFIERIDVVADGASAIYGSDAIAGVVNYITRKSYEGVEITPRFTHTHGYDQRGASIVAGHTIKDLGGFGKLSIVAAYDHDKRDAMLQGSTPFARQDLSRFGGLDNRIRTNLATSSAPGNIIVAGTGINPAFPSAGSFTYYGIPPGYGGTGLTGAQLLRNQPNLLDAGDYNDLIPENERNQASLNLNLQIDPKTRLYYQGYYNRSENTALGLAQPNATLTLPASSPYYIPGVPGIAAGAPQTVSFSFLKNVGRVILDRGHSLAEGYGNTVGFVRDFENKWRGEAIFSATGTKTCANCIPALNGNIYNPAAAGGAERRQLQSLRFDGGFAGRAGTLPGRGQRPQPRQDAAGFAALRRPAVFPAGRDGARRGRRRKPGYRAMARFDRHPDYLRYRRRLRQAPHQCRVRRAVGAAGRAAEQPAADAAFLAQPGRPLAEVLGRGPDL